MAFNKSKVMDAARKAVEKGQLDRAIKEYLKIVREDPKDVRVWLKIGDLYAKRGAKQDASETYLKVARFYTEQGFNRKAVAVYKQILKLDPRLVEVNLKLAELYRQLGLIAEALHHFETVAAFFHREGKIREAMATIRQLVDLDPDNIATRIKLAELYSKEEMVDQAIEEFAHACDYLRKNGREDDFVKVAERLLWHAPNNTELARELAALYLKRQDPRRALQKLQACFKADSRDVATLALLAQAFQALDQKGKTVSVLKELARVLVENGQRSQAGEVHRKILMYVPNDADALAFLGQAPSAPDGSSQMATGSSGQGTLSQSDLKLGGHTPEPVGGMTGAFPLIGNEEEPNAAIEAVPPDQLAQELSLEANGGFEGSTASAAAEVHSEEIVKILTETGVYVKYGLYQKAIDHLQRVFELDPANVEAREQLKDILLSQGREAEAARELIRLAEQTAPYEPRRAEGYIRDVLSIDAGYPEALDLAARYGLDIGAQPAEQDPLDFDAQHLARGAVAPVDDVPAAGGAREPSEDPLGEIDLDDFVVTPVSGGVGFEAAESSAPVVLDDEDLLEFDPDEGEPGVTSPEEVAPAADDELDFDLELRESGGVEQVAPAPDGTGTQEVELDQVEDEQQLARPGERLSPELEADFDFEDDEFGFDVEPPVPGEPAGASATAEHGRAGFGLDPAPGAERFAADPIEPGAFATGFSADGRPASEAPEELGEADLELLGVGGAPAAPAGAAGGGASAARAAGTALEDDLDEADFFLAQGLYDEARDILQALLARYPDHPLVLSKLADLGGDAAAAGAMPSAPETLPPEPAVADAEPRPQVMLEKPVEDEDADTHYDLGLAYKEMGLYDEAIKAFTKVLPVRGVQCRLMIGLCYREQGDQSEAINQFKAGLYVDEITDREKYSLYYEIGGSYEALDDPQEALYYFEMVLKKDPSFRDVRERAERLREAASRGQAGTGLDDGGDGGTDVAIEHILAERD